METSHRYRRRVITAQINVTEHPIGDAGFRESCRRQLDTIGALVLHDFFTPEAVAAVLDQSETRRTDAYFTTDEHTVYLDPTDPAYTPDHPRNQLITSTKGCLTDDQIPADSPLRAVYDSEAFRSFLCDVLDVDALHRYADPLASINVHFHEDGQELGWHFDNSSFAVTALIQAPEGGGRFDYIPALRDAESGDMNFDGVGRALVGEIPHLTLELEPGCLVLFRGRDALHRVTPSQGDRARIVAVLAYNTEPDVALSESARRTFFGRLS
jgi:hypothetical protein